MTDIYFYHLERQSVRELVPVLLEKVLERQWRALVVCRSREEMNDLNDHLWTVSQESFIPHGVALDGFPEGQPVLLTTGMENINKAQALVLFLNPDDPDQTHHDLSEFNRVMILFSSDEQKALARKAWTTYKTKGYTISYWKQDFTGRWQKQA